MRHFKLVIIFLLMATLIILFALQKNLFSDEHNQDTLNKLQKIETNSVILNEHILKIRQGLLRNYDGLMIAVDDMQKLTEHLKQHGYYHQDNFAINQLDHALKKLSSSVEHFLSVNAILNNSLAYFPLLVNEFAPHTEDYQREKALSHQLLEEIFVYDRWHEQQQKTALIKTLKRLETITIDSPEKTILLNTLISHAKNIINYSDLVDLEIKRIFSHNIPNKVALIHQQHLNYYTKHYQQENYLNLAVYAVSILLALLVFKFIIALRASSNSQNLINKQLLIEIQQREATEIKQKNEAIFLKTILDNISDGIMVCDNDGFLVLLNKSAESIYEKKFQALDIAQWTKEYPLYDKNNIQPLTKIQMPLHKALTKEIKVNDEEFIINPNHSTQKTLLINGTKIINSHGGKQGAVIWIRDISEQKKSDTEMRLAAIAFEAQEAIMIADAKGNIMRINQTFTKITGYSADDVIGKNPRLLKSGRHDERFYQQLWHHLKEQGYWHGEIYNRHKSGKIYPEWMSISVVKNELDEVTHYISHFKDLTELTQQQQHIERNAAEEKVLAQILKFSFLALNDFLLKSIEAIISMPWLQLQPKGGVFLRYKNSDMLNLICHKNLSPELLTLCASVPFGKCHCGKAAQTQKIQFSDCVDHFHEIRFEGMLPHGHYNIPIMDEDNILGVVVLYLAEGHQQQDYEINFLQRIADVLSLGISRKQAEEKVAFLAYHDSLTTLPNRLLFIERLEQVIAFNKHQNRFAALFYIDFDRFKNINDSLGHSVGDALLKEVAIRFKETLLKEDTVARLGGDEFVVLATEMSSKQEDAILEAQIIADKLHKVTSQEIRIQGHGVFISLSIGIVIITGEDKSTETLMIQADTAMYQAKANGKNGSQFFKPEMQTLVQTRQELEKDLRYALERNEIKAFYQPQTNAQGDIVGAEALVRWIHPQKGTISPIEFIGIAEESSIILDIGNYMLKDACLRINQWQDISTLEHIAVNVSPIQFKQQNFVETVINIIEETQTDASKLTLELTENILIDNVDDMIQKMQSLKKLGIHFSIDDFGTGYSSLAYLARFPLNQLKIDKSFIDDINKDNNEQIIIETIIAMAKRLGFNLIAEGVETQQQLNFLQNKGCYSYQGYYFSKPLSTDVFTKKYLI